VRVPDSVCSDCNQAQAQPQWGHSASQTKPFVVRHVEQERPRAGASSTAHALPAESHQAPAVTSDLAALRLTRPMAFSPDCAQLCVVEPTCIVEPTERIAVATTCMPATCMSGVECVRSVAAHARRQAIVQAARSKLEVVNRQQQRLAARRAALDERSSIPFVGTVEDNIMCMLLQSFGSCVWYKIYLFFKQKTSNLKI
jgi:hypothetical protein